MQLQRPSEEEYPSNYSRYVAMVPDTNIMEYLDRQKIEAGSFINGIEPEILAFRYAPGKWTVREILSHITDTERIFAYRALCISRGDQTPLPGFDQDNYTLAASADKRDINDLLEEFNTLRTANIAMFKGFTDDQWATRGIASDKEITVRAIPYIIAGHLAHHLKIIEDRYLIR